MGSNYEIPKVDSETLIGGAKEARDSLMLHKQLASVIQGYLRENTGKSDDWFYQARLVSLRAVVQVLYDMLKADISSSEKYRAVFKPREVNVVKEKGEQNEQ